MSPASRGCLFICLIAFVGLVVVSAVGGYAWMAYHAGSRTAAKAEEVERLRQQRIPTDTKELAKSYFTDPKAQARGDALIKAFGLYKISREFYREKDVRRRIMVEGDPLVPEDVKALRAHLELNAEFMAELRRLLQDRGDVQYPIDFSQGMKADFSFAGGVQIAVSMFVAAANIAVLDENIEGIVQNLDDAAHMVETLRDVPAYSVQLVRRECLSTFLDQCGYAIHAVPRGALVRVQKLLETLEIDGMFARGIVGELCIYRESVLDGVISTDYASSVLDLLPNRSLKMFMRKIWDANMFLTQSEIVKIGDLRPWERSQVAEETVQRVLGQSMLFHAFDQLWIASAGHVYKAENQILGIVAASQAGLAVLAYAESTGELPKDLSALVPNYLESVPLDPFDGQPVRYHPTETGFVVYSIAHNRVDDGGVPPSAGENVTRVGDLVFRVLDATSYLKNE